MKVLLTGGTGYIASHTAVQMVNAGHEVILLDNLSNSDKKVVNAIEDITHTKLEFIECDLRDINSLNNVFQSKKFDAVVHFAALKAVGESVKKPLLYYQNNIGGLMNLLQVMKEHNCNTIVFSSSATVYGDPQYLPYDENHPFSPTNPYGYTKLFAERILTDIEASDPMFKYAILRYFNPVGAHPSGNLGESPKGVPNNIMPYITQVASGQRQQLNIFGGDYNTKDGTCERDYIHIMDLAEGHLAALNYLKNQDKSIVVNLGSGKAVSVLELVKLFEEQNHVSIPYEIVERRAGDLPAFWADPQKAYALLGWKTQFGIKDMVRDAWRWEQNRKKYDK